MTHEVGLKKANGYGLYDMSGNVWEWCWDVYPDLSSRYYCGGSYGDFDDDCEVDNGDISNANDQYYNIGFRIVRNAD